MKLITDFDKNIDWRVRMKIDTQKEKSNKLKSLLINECSKDVKFFINYFGVTFDPRKRQSSLPFIPYKFQLDYLDRLNSIYNKKEDLLVEKSRDMGVTWITLYWILWKWLFEKGFQALIGSRKEELVDRLGVMDSLFEKIRFGLSKLPSWMLAWFKKKEHCLYMKLINPSNGAVIAGESSNQNFSRGGRYSIIFYDEFASWDYSESAWLAGGDSSPIRICVSTPNGLDNKFADLRFNSEISIKRIHWKLHPEKDNEWYNREKKRRNAREIAQELDIDYLQSGRPVFNTKYLKLQKKSILMPSKHNDRYAIGVDVATERGADWSVATVIDKARFEQVETIRGNFPIGTFAKRVKELAYKWNEAKVGVEINGVGQAFIEYFKKIYYNHYFRKDWDRISTRWLSRIGWQTTLKTKPILIDELESAIRVDNLKITDEQTLNELRVYQYEEGTKTNAPKSSKFNDDCVIALAIALQVLKDVPMPKNIYYDYREKYHRKKQFTYNYNNPRYNSLTGELVTK